MAYAYSVFMPYNSGQCPGSRSIPLCIGSAVAGIQEFFLALQLLCNTHSIAVAGVIFESTGVVGAVYHLVPQGSCFPTVAHGAVSQDCNSLCGQCKEYFSVKTSF